MDKKTTWIVLALILVALVGGYMLFAKQAAAPTTGTPVSEELPPAGVGVPTESESATIVTYTDEGFSPETVSISIGETVRFTNASSGGMWVGSDDHPTHTNYDGTSTREHCADGETTGGTFDACRAYANGESYDFTFTKAGTFEYHNHVGASKGGTVIVR
ncbi:hypothetical protein KJ819_03420 [Patescibacteria group bacterium]|nr:hypothetical protein [Patescibacteria group bacterium]MBU1500520.1 hypothetical protein [Patescibacteria group bacterium]MBU2080681.1 hypothetical protein [Patescibacteria group bacterium]MBU2123786.1 hypothetical protein [Patescibacteria group bacterium]MBU2194923.1 hypothetical protein [Patescibacteria group bacterium]